MIRQDFDTLPPKAFLMQILDNLAKIYLFLWDKKDEQGRLMITWRELEPFFQKNNFRSSLRKLCHKGLISYKDGPAGISVELVNWDEVND